MGQRTSQRARSDEEKRAKSAGAAGLVLSVFPSALGWMGVLGRDGRVVGLIYGFPSADELRREAVVRFAEAREGNPDALSETDWNPDLRLRLQKFADGEPVEFHDVEVEFPRMTPFQRRVIDATRRLRFGETVSYGELARRAGSPGAARAVGNVMKSNAVPLIVPCHRVVGSGGLGGYSAARGIEIKKSLLEREAEAGKTQHPAARRLRR